MLNCLITISIDTVLTSADSTSINTLDDLLFFLQLIIKFKLNLIRTFSLNVTFFIKLTSEIKNRSHFGF